MNPRETQVIMDKLAELEDAVLRMIENTHRLCRRLEETEADVQEIYNQLRELEREAGLTLHRNS